MLIKTLPFSQVPAGGHQERRREGIGGGFLQNSSLLQLQYHAISPASISCNIRCDIILGVFSHQGCGIGHIFSCATCQVKDTFEVKVHNSRVKIEKCVKVRIRQRQDRLKSNDNVERCAAVE